MDYTSFMQGIGQLGFPIFVAVWYMVKQSQDTKQMTDTLLQLKEAIVALTGDR